MDEKGISDSQLVVPEENNNVFCSMNFGVACAFFALGFLSRPDKEDQRWSQYCDKMVQGSAQILGLLARRIQREEANAGIQELLYKLETAEKEIKELKQLRREDAKANEKAVGIFASQEQCWLIERKKLRQHIGALMKELRLLEKNKDVISEMNDKLKEMELLMQSKDKALEDEENKRKDVEEKLINAESIAEELRETAKREAQEHSTDLWKHKTAFLELVSNQRQLEAEMGRTIRQLEAKRQELDSILEQKEESVLLAQKLSMEIVKIRKDLEQKDKILSALLRKSKLDTAEKQMLSKEVKLLKAKWKEAELETNRWKAVSGSRHERHSLRSMFDQVDSRSDDPSVARAASQIGKGRSQTAESFLEYANLEFRRDSEVLSPFSDCYSPQRNDEKAETDIKQLEGWVRSEAEKYVTVIEKRHHLEIDAFAEQMRLKDEKLEAFRWKLLSMEIESKRLQSYVEGINQDTSQLQHENMKLEALLLERQQELNGLKEKPQIFMHTNLNSSSLQEPALDHRCNLSKDKAVKRRPTEREQETKENFTEISQENVIGKGEEPPSNQSKNVVQSPEKEFEEENDVSDKGCIHKRSASGEEIDNVIKVEAPSQPLIKANNSPWRMDLHALGVSYKIKRLTQQLLMLERLTRKQGSGKDAEEDVGNAENGIKNFLLLMTLLNKQVNRYQSLQTKTDELCKRMQDSDAGTRSRGDSSSGRTKGETKKTLEHYLEETFQLQRYMVAMGQKMMEVQSKIGCGFVGVPEMIEDSATSFDMERFVDNIKTLFQEVQRGLEVRISRIIGDLEGTLACEGIIRIRR